MHSIVFLIFLFGSHNLQMVPMPNLLTCNRAMHQLKKELDTLRTGVSGFKAKCIVLQSLEDFKKGK